MTAPASAQVTVFELQATRRYLGISKGTQSDKMGIEVTPQSAHDLRTDPILSTAVKLIDDLEASSAALMFEVEAHERRFAALHTARSISVLFLERQDKLLSALSERFKNITAAASVPPDTQDITGQLAAAQSMTLNVETQALIHAAESLLTHTRQLKELWLFGPLRGLGEGETEKEEWMGGVAKEVVGRVEGLITSTSLPSSSTSDSESGINPAA